MDEIMTEARYGYELSIPARRDEQYTLGDTWPKSCADFSKLNREVSGSAGAVVSLLDRLPDLHRVRSYLGGHDNEFASEYPLSAIREMARDCLRFLDLLLCDHCNGLAVPVKRASEVVMLKCKCDEGLRYPPAVMVQGPGTKD
jgi:hypothetical protein